MCGGGGVIAIAIERVTTCGAGADAQSPPSGRPVDPGQSALSAGHARALVSGMWEWECRKVEIGVSECGNWSVGMWKLECRNVGIGVSECGNWSVGMWE